MRKLMLTLSAAAILASTAATSAFALTAPVITLYVQNQTSETATVTDTGGAFPTEGFQIVANSNGGKQLSCTGCTGYASNSDTVQVQTAPDEAYCTYGTSTFYNSYYHHYQYTSSATPTAAGGNTPTCTISLNEYGQLSNGSYQATMTIAGY